jgi:opacity protein-like surface antigen
MMLIATAIMCATPLMAFAQASSWAAEASVGWAGFVDDSTKNYLLVGGNVRRNITPRVSIGPELVFMSNSDELHDRNVMLTGNVVFDAAPGARLVPFVIGGAGMFWGRDQVNNGPYWSSDPAFTVGGGIRANLTDSVTASMEYRFGWELHHRFSGSAGIRW